MEEPKNNILGNALQFLELGVNDYRSMVEEKKKTRVLSAVTNIYAGTLLLLKERLRREKPEGKWILQKFDPKNPNKDRCQEQGEKTVSVSEIMERINLCESTFPIDLSALKKIREERNFIEHQYTSKTSEDLKPIIEDCIIFSMTVFSDILKEQIENHVTFKKTWGRMKTIKSEREQNNQ